MLSRSTSHTSSQHHDTLDTENSYLHRSVSGRSTQSQSRFAYHRPSCQQDDCEHGLLSPHANRPGSSSSTQVPDDTDRSEYFGFHPNRTQAASDKPAHSQSPNGGVHGGAYPGERDTSHALLGDAVADGLLGGGTDDRHGQDENGHDEPRAKWKGAFTGISTTQWLAKNHGVRRNRIM